MKKKLLALLLALIAIFTFAACGTAATDTDTGDTEDVSAATGYTVTFVTDDNVTVTVYNTQDMSAGGETADTAYSRDGTTGELTTDGTGQVNFILSFADGYELDGITVDGTYKNLKGSADTEVENGYRITKIESDLTVTVSSKAEEAVEDLSQGYKVTFVTDDNVTVTVYRTQDLSEGGETTDTAYSRDGATGSLTLTDGQVNFVLTFADGYELDGITVDGEYKNLKYPSDVGTNNAYRITKIAGELTVSVTSKIAEETETETETAASFLSSYNGTSYTLNVTAEFGEFSSEIKNGALYLSAETGATLTLTGTYAGGVVITADENYDVTVNLSGATLIANGELPALYIVSANNADISATSGTENYIFDYRAETEDLSSAIYCVCDLNLKGKGSLTVVSQNNKGIHSKDDLTVKNLTLNVTCTDNALKGNDSVTVSGGTLTLIATEGDGIKTSNSKTKYNEDGSVKKIQGTITISGGTVNIYSASDGIDASYDVVITGGTVNVYTTKTYAGSVVSTAVANSDEYYYLRYSSGDYKYSVYFYNTSTGDYVWVNPDSYDKVTSNNMGGGFGRPGQQSSSSAVYYYRIPMPEGDYNAMIIYAYTDSQIQGSADAYYAKSDALTVNTARDTVVMTISSSKKISTSWTTYSGDGTASSKGIKSDNEIKISGGTITIKSYDDAIHANNDVILGDEDDATDDYYGKGNVIISGGNITITTKDDGIRADQDLTVSGSAVINVLTSYEGLEANRIYIQGGTVFAYATDDAMNAAVCNGSYSPLVSISGGYVDLSVGSGDTDTLDSNGNVIISGGTLILKNPQSNGTSMTGGTMDLDGTLTVTGGNVISIGCWGNETSMSAQASSTSTTLSKGDYTIKDASGNTVAEFSLSANYRGYRIYCYGKSGTYTLYNGSSKVISF